MPLRDFPGGPLVKTPHFHCRGCEFNLSSGKFHMLCRAAKKNQKVPFYVSYPFFYWIFCLCHTDVQKCFEYSDIYILSVICVANIIFHPAFPLYSNGDFARTKFLNFKVIKLINCVIYISTFYFFLRIFSCPEIMNMFSLHLASKVL